MCYFYFNVICFPAGVLRNPFMDAYLLQHSEEPLTQYLFIMSLCIKFSVNFLNDRCFTITGVSR